MKTYIIFASVAVISSIIFLGVPQLTGTAFVNNPQEQKPADWLSAQMLKLRKMPAEQHYEIPANIRTICIQLDNASEQFYHSSIHINTADKQQVSYIDEHGKFAFRIINDTLWVESKSKYCPPLSFQLDSTIQRLAFDKSSKAEVSIDQTNPLLIAVEDQSDIILRGNRNLDLHQITVSGQSTLLLSHCLTPVIDMQIDNSMVYIDRFNNIDSLKANLMGKSNIKLTNKLEIDGRAQLLIEEFNLDSYFPNIYPSGNLEYYNLAKVE